MNFAKTTRDHRPRCGSRSASRRSTCSTARCTTSATTTQTRRPRTSAASTATSRPVELPAVRPAGIPLHLLSVQRFGRRARGFGDNVRGSRFSDLGPRILFVAPAPHLAGSSLTIRQMRVLAVAAALGLAGGRLSLTPAPASRTDHLGRSCAAAHQARGAAASPRLRSRVRRENACRAHAHGSAKGTSIIWSSTRCNGATSPSRPPSNRR